MSVERTIICDDCGVIMGAAKTAKLARVEASYAWGASNRGTKDYCETCRVKSLVGCTHPQQEGRIL